MNGNNTHDVFKFLRYNSELHDPTQNAVGHIHWNFGKFLVDPSGQDVQYINSRHDLKEVEKLIADRLK